MRSKVLVNQEKIQCQDHSLIGALLKEWVRKLFSKIVRNLLIVSMLTANNKVR